VPATLLQVALGELASELVGSARVIPAKLGQAGFAFRYPGIGPALTAALG